MKKKFFYLAPISLILLAAMQQQTQNSKANPNAHAMQSPAGGVKTNAPMPHQSVSPKTVAYHYTIQKPNLKNTADKKNATHTALNSFFLPLHLTPPDPYDACVITPANCNNNMAGYIIPLDSIQKSGKISYAKQIGPIINFKDVSYQDDKLDNLSDDFYMDTADKSCNNINFCSNDSSVLYYYVYYPLNVDYSNCQLPCILLFHAGGFSDCSNLKYEDTLCYGLARKGFIVFNIEYRRGRIKATGTNYTTIQQMLAIGRAFQDGRGAIRSIIKRQRNILSHPLPYQIDTNYMFVAGQSAGATIANSLAYYTDQAMIDSIFPVPPGEAPISAAIGNMDQDFYFGGPGIEYHSKIKGLWSMWGGFPMPTIGNTTVDEYKFLTRGYETSVKLVPMIGFMGTKDPVFPISEPYQYVYYPPKFNGKYVKETSCILNDSIKIYKNFNNTPNLRIECTNDIFTIFKYNGIPTLQYLDTTMGHGLTRLDSLGICPSDFGVAGSLTINQVNEYLAARACFYFQSIIKNKVSILEGVKKFINCEDFRHSPDVGGDCATKADNDGCH